MSDLRSAAEKALKALEGWKDDAPSWWTTGDEKTITALRAALEQPEQPYAEQARRVEQETHGRMWINPVNGDVSIGTPTDQPEQEPVAWQERQAKRMKDGVVTEWGGWYPCRYRTIDEAKAEACDHIPYEWRPLFTHPPRREWRGLTEKEHEKARHVCRHVGVEGLVLWLEDKLKERNA